MSKNDLLKIEQIKKKYDYADILYFRNCALALMRKHVNDKPAILRSEYKKTEQQSSGVFSSWLGGGRKKVKAAEIINMFT